MEPKQEVLPPQQVSVRIPKLSLNDVEGFSKVWRKGGADGKIIVILDQTAKEFARDFAQIVLQSFVLDQINRATQAQARLAQQGQPAMPPTAPAPASKLILEG